MENINNEEREKQLEQEVEEIQKEQTTNIQNSRRKRKRILTRVIAVILAGTLITGIIHIFKRFKNNPKDNGPTQSTIDPTYTINPEDEIDINDLGVVYDDPTLETEKLEYGNTTGDINKEDLVEKDDTIWKDEEAADNSSNVGKEEVDDKGGNLEVKPNGDVHEKEDGYEVVDGEGNVKEEGSNENGIPEGYAWDDVLGKYVKEEDVGKYVYVDATYYDENGNVVFEKGDIVTKETLEMIKKTFTTTKPTVSQTQPEIRPEETVPETKPEEPTEGEIIVTEQGTINPDGTYTIFGLIFESKADYEQWVIQGYEGYAIDLDGIMKPEEEIIAKYNQKTK